MFIVHWQNSIGAPATSCPLKGEVHPRTGSEDAEGE
jgi:hypothetical protein